MNSYQEIELWFNEIMEQHSAEQVRDFVNLHSSKLTVEERIEFLNRLLKENWHYEHDHIVSNFQWMSNAKSIDSLYETALNKEIEPMDYKPIARRCTWALADIGTVDAKLKLEGLAQCGDTLIEGFASKRFDNWEKEKYRKGLKHRLVKGRSYLYLDYYEQCKHSIEDAGQQIVTGQQTQDHIVVYQAYNAQIANYAVAHQRFGGNHYSFNRMTWIKPNFLWMMYRSGWAQKPNQERILAISISKEFFIHLLKEGEVTSIKQSHYSDTTEWKKMLDRSEVRIQWDPHHRPDESKLERKAIQIGIKGSLQKEFGTKQIHFIEDITDFVLEQKKYIDRKDYQYLKIPIETELEIMDRSIIEKLSIKK
ncbi:MAG: DUF4291 domain-containing protein [Bacteroidota bacterium]